MNKQKGFTLVELLAVIVVLGIILSITTVSILKIKEKQDEENLKNTVSSILTAAKEKNVEERANEFVISTLKSEGYIDYDGEAKYDGKTYDTILAGLAVQKLPCPNDQKLKYYLNIPEVGKEFNDCGCDDVQDGSISDKICTGS